MSLPNENAAQGVQPAAASNRNSDATILNGSFRPVKFSYPDPETVKGRVLGTLLRVERLTHLDCWRRFGSARLSHHIYCLRGLAWPVRMIEETVTTSDAGRPATIGVYFLDADVIAEAGEAGQRYAEECARVELERRAA